MLNLYEILQKVLNESVESNDVCNAISGHNYVEITYVDEDSNAPGKRLIQPYAYGLTRADNECLRAFQVSGDSLRGRPKWKLFLLNKITSWEPRKQTFETPPPMQGYNSPDYNRNGDRTMKKVIFQAVFNDTQDPLSRERAKTQTIQSAPKIASKNTSGPIPNASQQWKKNVFTSQPNSARYAQYAKNIKDTENDINRFDKDLWDKAEAEAKQQQQDAQMLQNSAKAPEQNVQGPIDTKNNKKKQ